MPKSFLVKRVQKIHKAFFPWNSTTLVPGYSLSCEVERDFKKDGYEEEASEIDVLNCDKHEVEESVNRRNSVFAEEDYKTPHKNGSTLKGNCSEIKILKPQLENHYNINHRTYAMYNNTNSSNSSISSISSVNSNDNCNGKEIIPSPIGPPRNTYGRFPITEFSQQYNIAHFYPHHRSINTTMVSVPQHHPFESLENFRKHQCEYCFKWFKRSSSLSNHRLIHKNDKTFKCNQCNMCFLRKSDLGKHMVIHSGSKPYQCNVCGKRFSQSSNMLTHQRRHTGIRPYSCTICGKSFYRKVDVRRHASVHREY